MFPALLLGLFQAPIDRTAMTDGVDSLIAPGAVPSAVVAGKESVVLLRIDDAPVVVAGRVGQGRAMVAGHGGIFSAASLKNPSNARFFANSLAWLGGKPVRGLRIGMIGSDNVSAAARALGAEAVSLDRGPLQAGLLGVDVLFMGQGALDGDEVVQNVVTAWVRAGHALYTAGPGWGWQQLNPNKSIRTDLAANRMLLPFGMGLSGEVAFGTPVVKGAEDPLLQVDSALSALRKGGLPAAETTRATQTVSRMLALSSLEDKGLVAEIQKLALAEGAAKWPITTAMPFTRLQARIKVRAWEESSPEKVKADPGAAVFPGSVPKEARRISRSVEVDTRVPQWHGLGLYAAPGELVKVTLPASAVGKGIGVRIGGHTDELWDVAKWDRFPQISRRWQLNAPETKLASPFGGTVYVDVPEGCALGKISVTVQGAVAAPRYVRGETSAADWAKMRAEPGAPWVDLEAHGIILSVPRSAIVSLTDPEPLMAYWDEVADLCYGLYAAPRRSRPERYCVDRQISVGYMHAGYPIMTWEDVAPTFTNVEKLRSKEFPWGFYHELGHNFQESAWTFDGTGEVTNNLFSLYGCEKINGIAHPGGMNLEERAKRMEKYFAAGARFEDWKKDPFLALTMYDQLREAFGWGPFTRTFATYRRLGLSPKGELAQHDEWMVRMSEATGRNLGPFFTAWGVPTSEAARGSVAKLPAWMPADMAGR